MAETKQLVEINTTTATPNAVYIVTKDQNGTNQAYTTNTTSFINNLELQKELIAGDNIVISADGRTISATGGGSGSANWGSIGGTLSNQTDLQAALDSKANTSTTYTKTETDSAITSHHDSTKADVSTTYSKTDVDTRLNAKQDTLVSATNIKTINNQSILGSGNIDIQGGGGTSDYTQLSNKPQINSVELSGNKTLSALGIDKMEVSATQPTNPDVNIWIDSDGSVDGVEMTANKVTTISSASTNTQYPSALAVYQYVQSLNANEVAY